MPTSDGTPQPGDDAPITRVAPAATNRADTCATCDGPAPPGRLRCNTCVNVEFDTLRATYGEAGRAQDRALPDRPLGGPQSQRTGGGRRGAGDGGRGRCDGVNAGQTVGGTPTSLFMMGRTRHDDMDAAASPGRIFRAATTTWLHRCRGWAPYHGVRIGVMVYAAIDLPLASGSSATLYRGQGAGGRRPTATRR